MNKFKAGDRVAVYDETRWGRKVMTITNTNRFITYLQDNYWGQVAVRTQQLRRLKPTHKNCDDGCELKPKKAPREWRLAPTAFDTPYVISGPNITGLIDVREVMTDTVTVSREELAKAWDKHAEKWTLDSKDTFDDLCKAIGLGSDERKAK